MYDPKKGSVVSRSAKYRRSLVVLDPAAWWYHCHSAARFATGGALDAAVEPWRDQYCHLVEPVELGAIEGRVTWRLYGHNLAEKSCAVMLASGWMSEETVNKGPSTVKTCTSSFQHNEKSSPVRAHSFQMTASSNKGFELANARLDQCEQVCSLYQLRL